MFTGIIQDCGSVSCIDKSGSGITLRIKSGRAGFWNGSAAGDSIGVNGVCLTLEAEPSGATAVFSLLEETFSVTALGTLKPGSAVNLEKAMVLGGRLGGHLVSGHVDCAGRVTQKGRRGPDAVFTISFPRQYRPYLVEKGSVAVSGISLTVMELSDDSLTVNIIPHTYGNTCMKNLGPGDLVNLEFDLIGKYVLNACRFGAACGEGDPGMDIGFLRENGFA